MGEGRQGLSKTRRRKIKHKQLSVDSVNNFMVRCDILNGTWINVYIHLESLKNTEFCFLSDGWRGSDSTTCGGAG